VASSGIRRAVVVSPEALLNVHAEGIASADLASVPVFAATAEQLARAVPSVLALGGVLLEGPATTAPHDQVSATLEQLQYRVTWATQQLAAFGFPDNTSYPGGVDGTTTIIATDAEQGRTFTLTMTPGTMLLPENHDRAPITTTEKTADRIRMVYDSNTGWRFTLVVERTGTTRLPSEDDLANLLYGIDP